MKFGIDGGGNMSITKSYNHQTNTTYAYETTYEWSDEKQRKIQKKKCIGQFDPVTGAIIPNGRRGRPSGSANVVRTEASIATLATKEDSHDLVELDNRLGMIETTLATLTAEIHGLKLQAEKALSER